MPNFIGKAEQAVQYIRYLLKAQTAHHIHSPFVFDLYNNVIRSQKSFYAFKDIEEIRSSLLKNPSTVTINDLGAGPKNNSGNVRKIKSIASTALATKKKARLLFRLVEYFKPEVMIELGTSLGVSSLYQAGAYKEGQLITFEGSHDIADVARNNFSRLNIHNIKLVEGNIDHTLPHQLDQLSKIDYAYIDANHQYEPTVRYYETLLSKASENCLIIFDDIYWSKEMTKAWNEIIQRKEVGVSIDLFDVGLVFLKQDQVKQHFILKF